MPIFHALRRALAATAVSAAAIIPSYTAGAAEPADRPVGAALLAPFECGTQWQGSTYGGHGANNWNLDLNRAGDAGGSDLGEPILAQADGTVVWFKQTGWNNRAGTYIEIDYGDVTVRYIHLVSGSIPAAYAEIGARVEQGGQIGELGATGRVSGPHLHLEYWDSAGYKDTAWFELPRGNQIPVAFEGQEMIATLQTDSEIATSTNCPGRRWQELRQQLADRRAAWRVWAESGQAESAATEAPLS